MVCLGFRLVGSLVMGNLGCWTVGFAWVVGVGVCLLVYVVSVQEGRGGWMGVECLVGLKLGPGEG